MNHEMEEPDNTSQPALLLSDELLSGFTAHLQAVTNAQLKIKDALTFKSVIETGQRGTLTSTGGNNDADDGLGLWTEEDEFQGDVNYRTLQRLLRRVDQRGESLD
jgi:hypothetical protein